VAREEALGPIRAEKLFKVPTGRASKKGPGNLFPIKEVLVSSRCMVDGLGTLKGQCHLKAPLLLLRQHAVL
jgi:hypothetical protein